MKNDTIWNDRSLHDSELGNVTGGAGDTDRRDIDDRKDLYENIILHIEPEEHNVMRNDGL